ncbi:hypothetical protein [uncultured Bacteroides sp.]|uniref:hypothetical protein n=1 Tax=uncultured Bacteroides sp. TaxID=162156 RepID=UPI0025D685EA|nr:hypothetical protein [uncultured Bacteroides sp.]
MEAILNKEQVRPGDETQFMHAAFTSEEEMMSFYLILNRFVNQSTYFMQRPDVERLEDLLRTLGKFQHFTNHFGTHEIVGIKPLVEGFGLYMMQQTIPDQRRKLAAEHVGYQARFFMDIMKDTEQARMLSHIIASHIANVKYLLEKLKETNE